MARADMMIRNCVMNRDRGTSPSSGMYRGGGMSKNTVTLKLCVLLACFGLLAGSSVLAQPESGRAELRELLLGLEAHPALRAARLRLEAAERDRAGAAEPFALSLEGGFSAFDTEPLDLSPQEPGLQGLPASAGQFGVELVLKPFALPEVIGAKGLALEGARLTYAETRSDLEAGALEALLGAQLAADGLELAAEGASLAGRALAATELRAERGAASARELRDAETALAEAEAALADAEARLGLAEATLLGYFPAGAALKLRGLRLPRPSGTPLRVARAALGVAGARLERDLAERTLLPVVQAGYSRNLDASSSLGVSLETRTLQPRLRYDYADPGRSPPQTAVNGSFQLGLALRFSAADLAAAERADALLEAAQAELAAASAAAELQALSLREALETALRAERLAAERLAAAEARFRESAERAELGLSSPLETPQAALERSRSGLALAQAQLEVLARLLDAYRFFGLSLSEVLAPEDLP